MTRLCEIFAGLGALRHAAANHLCSPQHQQHSSSFGELNHHVRIPFHRPSHRRSDDHRRRACLHRLLCLFSSTSVACRRRHRLRTSKRWPANNHSGGSRPLLADHAELAALEQRQFEAARARHGWRPICRALSSSLDKCTHRRLPADIAPAHGGCPPVLFQPPEHFSAGASAHLGPCLAAAQCLCPPTAAGLYLYGNPSCSRGRARALWRCSMAVRHVHSPST